MKNFLWLTMLSGAALGIAAQASAHGHGHWDHPRHPYVIDVYGFGKGGTFEGDRNAAKERAYDRAARNAQHECYRRQGEVLDTQEIMSDCHRRGTREYGCESRVRVACEIY